MTLTGNSRTTPVTWNLDWTGVAYGSMSNNGQGGVYYNNIDVNEGLVTGVPNRRSPPACAVAWSQDRH
jgi:hypothetical protein